MAAEIENDVYYADGEFSIFDFIHTEWAPIRVLVSSIEDILNGDRPAAKKANDTTTLFHLLADKVSKVDSIFEKIDAEDESPKIKQKN